MNLNLVLIFQIVCILAFKQLQIVSGQCWATSYGRGVGTVPSSCDDDQDKDASLCYKECKSGYSGVGPICWEKCSSGYVDSGLLCLMNAHIYGKGCCCIKIFGKRRCCNKCNDGYHDDGCTCRRNMKIYDKDSYGRGAGEVMKCKDGEEKDGGLCYKPCKDGYKGVGPVCWFKGCNGAYEHACGLLCTQDASECASISAEIAIVSVSIIADVAIIVGTLGAFPGAWIGAGSDVLALSSILINDVCENPNKLATKCWKDISDSGLLADCGGINPKDCGLFCASSNVQCAKISIGLVSGIEGLVSLVLGDATSTAMFKGNVAKLLDQAKDFVKNFDSKVLIAILKSSKKLLELDNLADMFKLSNGLKGIADLVSGQVFDTC